MEKIKLAIDKDECYELTHKLFMQMSGIDKDGPKFDRMKEDAGKIREQIEDRIDINIACHYYRDISFDGKNANIGGEIFSCNAFEQIDEKTVNGAYIYALTAGEYDFKEQPIMNRLYADIWGTSFTDAARILLKQKIGKREKLSDSFGPGFYGMDLSDLNKIDNLIDFSDLGIELRKNCILVPVKSCAGIYFNVNSDYKAMNSSCSACIGSEKSCKLCRQREKN